MKRLLIILLVLFVADAFAQSGDSSQSMSRLNIKSKALKPRLVYVDGKRYDKDISLLDSNKIVEVYLKKGPQSKIHSTRDEAGDTLFINTIYKKTSTPKKGRTND